MTITDRLRIYSDIFRYKKRERDQNVISDEYNEGFWNRKYEEINFEQWLGNYGADGNAQRILVQNGKLFKGTWKDYTEQYHNQIFSILQKYKNDPIVEMGCGLGHNIFQLHKKGFADLAGYDVSENAIHSIKRYCDEKNIRITFGVLDLTKPFPKATIKDKVVFTHTCLEQLKRFMPDVLKNIIAAEPKLVINFEVDYDSAPFMVKRYFDAKDYQNNLVRELRKLEKSGKIQIIKIEPLQLYLSPTNRPSVITWKPLSA